MYTCPHCKNVSISIRSLFSAPFDGKVQCPACSTIVKTKRKLSNYLVAFYIFAVVIVDRVFHVNIGLDTAFGLVLAFSAGLFQIKLASFKEAGNH